MIYKISDLGQVVGGGTPSTKHDNYYTKYGIPWITPKDLSNYDYIYISHGNRDITKLGYKNSSAKMVPKNTILISSRAPIGYVAISKNDVCTNQGFKSIIPNEKIVYPEYLYYAIKFNISRLINVSSGSTFQEISGRVMKNFKINIPTLNEQKNILNKVIPLERKISINKQINNNLLKLLQKLYIKNFQNNENELVPLKNYILPKRGKNILKRNVIDGNIPVIAGGLNPTTYHNQSNTKAPVITISSSGANAGYVNIWERNIWSSDSSYIDKSMSNNIYFWYLLLKDNQQNIFNKQYGSAQPHIYPKHIGNLLIHKLNMSHVQKFNINVAPFFNKIGENIKENIKLQSIKDKILILLVQ